MLNDQQCMARRIASLVDLTAFRESNTEESTKALCEWANSLENPVAAVCVLPAYVRCAREALASGGKGLTKVATVANFPDGAVDLLGAYESVLYSVEQGADEIDLVFPWRALMAGDCMVGQEMVQACVRCCDGQAGLSVIIESGQLASPVWIRQASEIVVGGGATFIKTSTGESDVGATMAAVQIMAEVLSASNGSCGLKISGGVQLATEAYAYLQQVEAVMGHRWATPSTLRFASSSLLGSLQSVIEGKAH